LYDTRSTSTYSTDNEALPKDTTRKETSRSSKVSATLERSDARVRSDAGFVYKFAMKNATSWSLNTANASDGKTTSRNQGMDCGDMSGICFKVYAMTIPYVLCLRRSSKPSIPVLECEAIPQVLSLADHHSDKVTERVLGDVESLRPVLFLFPHEVWVEAVLATINNMYRFVPCQLETTT
jgi:hypothetical protein